MGVWPEVMRLIDGRLFDAESYEHTDLLSGSFAGAPGYYVVVWDFDAAPTERAVRPAFVGPFPSPDLAFATASKLKTKSVLSRSP